MVVVVVAAFLLGGHCGGGNLGVTWNTVVTWALE